MWTSLQQAYQEGVCKGLRGHLFLLLISTLVPAASVAELSHVRAPLPGPALPSVCSSLIPCHRMCLLTTDPIWPHPTVNPPINQGRGSWPSPPWCQLPTLLPSLERLLRHVSGRCTRLASRITHPRSSPACQTSIPCNAIQTWSKPEQLWDLCLLT